MKSPLGATQPSIQWVPGLFPWGKVVRGIANYSSPSSAEVMNVWSHTSTPFVIKSWWLVK